MKRASVIGKGVIYFILIAFCFVTFSLVILWNSESDNSSSKYKNTEKIQFMGKYSFFDDSETFELNPSTNIGLSSDRRGVILKGHFSGDIEKNKMIIMRLDNVNISIYVNDKVIYSLAGDKQRKFSKSPGNGWESFISPGITKNDEVMIEISNVYSNHSENVVNTFLDNLYSGSEGEVFLHNIRGNFWNTCITMFIICMGIIVLAFAILLIKSLKYTRVLICFACMAISSGSWFFIDFDTQNLYINRPVFNNSLDIVSMLFAMCLFALYFAMHIENVVKIALKISSYSSALLIIVSTITQLFRILDYYDYVFIIEAICAINIICIFVGVTYEYYKNRYKESAKFLISTYILLVGMVMDISFIICQISYEILWFKISFFAFILIQFFETANDIKKYIAENARVGVLEKMAYQDALTGTNNKAAYIKRINQIEKNIKNRKKYAFSVVVFDINNLKNVNDNFGHEKGDELIKMCGYILCKVFSIDNIFRIGGDEFTAIIEKNNGIEKMIEEFTKEMENKSSENDNISIAYGMALYRKYTDNSYSDVFVRADSLMYAKKQEMKSIM